MIHSVNIILIVIIVSPIIIIMIIARRIIQYSNKNEQTVFVIVPTSCRKRLRNLYMCRSYITEILIYVSEYVNCSHCLLNLYLSSKLAYTLSTQQQQH